MASSGLLDSDGVLAAIRSAFTRFAERRRQFEEPHTLDKLLQLTRLSRSKLIGIYDDRPAQAREVGESAFGLNLDPHRRRSQ
jgi:hypothetical protein